MRIFSVARSSGCFKVKKGNFFEHLATRKKKSSSFLLKNDINLKETNNYLPNTWHWPSWQHCPYTHPTYET